MVISHSHYDHLCSRSVEDLRARFGEGGSVALAAKAAGAAASKPLHWYVPLGMAAWFHDAGVRDVTELDWWQEASHGGVRVACTPAQHWSARTPFDKNTTLWASWYDFSCMLCTRCFCYVLTRAFARASRRAVIGKQRRFWFGAFLPHAVPASTLLISLS